MKQCSNCRNKWDEFISTEEQFCPYCRILINSIKNRLNITSDNEVLEILR